MSRAFVTTLLVGALAFGPFAFGPFGFGAVNARNGVTVSTASTINGRSPLSAVNGQTLAAGGAPTPDLLHWPLNDASGSTIAASVGPGSTTSTGTLNSDFLAMASGNGNFESSSSVTWGTNIISVSAWMRFPDWSNAGVILQTRPSTINYRCDIVKDGGWFTLRAWGDTGGKFERIYQPVATNTWAHFVAVFDCSTASGVLKLYMNGSAQTLSNTADSRTGTANFTTDALSIKSGASPDATFDLDDLRIYTGELNTTQISAIYAAGRP